ncbi:tubulin epsilon and delta complex protein 2 isoform X2 [Hemiscyllium ocellatum]|uniref:tubulin epsilon and delta complex protein 2 isoform X2 n=1 Tax=Hemiscyllium ocellatum TaxID=170820 RepID=UPI0029675033|nr:tubulin epsilon and delta complex protein 2 isoform X2 [Hemiscyllium ocellatum]
MLPAPQARRLSSLLVEAIKECTEEERKLEDELKSFHKLLKPWNPSTREKPAKNGTTTSRTEHASSYEELQELALLNRTLAKALRIRQTHQNVFEIKQIQPHTSDDITVPTNAGYGIVKHPQAASYRDKPLEDVLSRTLWSGSKTKLGGANMNNTCGKVAASECKERYLSSHLAHGVAGKRIAAHAVSSRKPESCTLKLPYKTKQDVKRKSTSSAVGKLVRGSLHTSGLVKTAAIQQTKRSASVDRAGNRAQQSRLWSLKTIPRTIASHNGLNLEDTNIIQRTVTPHSMKISAFADSAPKMTSPVMSQQRANCMKETVHMSASEQNMLQNESSSMEKLKLFTLQESGSTLKLPSEWRKQRCRNARLWGQVSASETDEIQKASFMQNIHSALPPVSCAQIEEQLDNIYELYKCIDQYVRTDFQINSSGPLSYQHERESLQILGRCQDTVSSLIQQIEQFVDAETFWTKFGSCWTVNFKKCKCFGGKSAPLLFYSTLQELKEMEALRFQVHTLQRQIQIQKAMAEELLPILFSSMPLEQSVSYLYRAVYAELCEGGEQFPALVQDNIPE